MKKDDFVHLTYILDSCDLAAGFVNGLSEEDFHQDDKTKYACVRCIEIIGEASKNLSESFKSAHTDIDWRGAMGMRDRLAHGYLDTDFRIVWDTLVHELPKFSAKIKAITAKLNQ